MNRWLLVLPLAVFGLMARLTASVGLGTLAGMGAYVGVVLLGEGGHVAHLKLFGYAVEPLSKTTFYFSIAVLVIVDIVQSKYQNKLAAERKAAQAKTADAGAA